MKWKDDRLHRSTLEIFGDEETITTLARRREASPQLVDDVVRLLQQYPDLRFIEIEDKRGHDILVYRGRHPDEHHRSGYRQEWAIPNGRNEP